MIRNLHFYKWFVAVVVLICSTITVSAQTKVTSVSQLKGGSVIKIYPKDNNGTSHYGENNYALACSGDGQSLTSYEEAGSGDEWTLEDAGDGYCYLKNDKGCYWTNQKRSYSESLICTLDKSSAVKICLTWDTKYSGVCFWNEKDDRGLNNLDGSNCRYNWCYDSGEFNFGDNITFYIALLKEGSGNDFVKGKVIETWVNKIKYYLDTKHKTAEIVSQYGHFSGDIVIPETITYDNVTYKVTSLGKACFLGSSSMTSISLPSGIISLGDYCFSGCSSLASISLSFGVTSLGDECFKGCSKFTSITLPSSITSLGGWCFEDCGNLKSILCLAVEPPRCYYKDVVDKTTSLYVPKESVEKYKQSAAWNSAYGIYPLYPASSISLVKEISVIKTKSTKLEYTIMPENAGTKELEWSSEDPEVATVDANGMVTGKKVGKVAITAITKDGTGIIASSSINVIPLMVSDFSLQTTSAMRTIATQLDTNITPSEADNKKLKWSSLTPDIAIVTEDGVLTGLKVGTAKVKAETTDGSKLSKTFNVEVKTLPVGSITLPSTPVSVVKTKTGKIKVTIEPLAADNQKLIWTSSRPDIATVDNEGVVTGKKVGTTRITASTTDGTNLKASVDVNIQPLKVETMAFAEPSVSIVKTENKTIKLTLNSEEVDNKSMVWTSSDESVATVVQNPNSSYPLEAIVTAHKIGKATIKAEAQDGSGISATCEVEVTPLMVSDFSLLTASVVKTIPTQLEVKVSPAEADNKKLKWTSLTPDIATVTEDGMLTGLKMGTAQIKAEALDGSNISKTFNVEVTGLPVSSISLPTTPVSVVKTKTGKIKVVVEPLESDNQKLTWTSSRPDIAIVDNEGVVTGKKVGTTRITASTTDGTNLKASVDVNIEPLKVETMAFAEPSVSIVKTEDKTITLTLNSEEVDNKSMVWTSSDESVATVVQNMNAVYPLEAIVVAHKVGKATIKAEAQDGSGMSATCEVEVTPLMVSDFSLLTASVVRTIPTQLEAKVSPADADNKKLKWTNLTPDIATVTEDGMMTGLKIGTAKVKAETTDGSNLSGVFEVQVTGLPVSTISLPADLLIVRTESMKLEYSILPLASDNQKLKWSSNATYIASVDENTGVITAHKVGDAVITATATDGSGISASTTIHVTPLKVSHIDMLKEISLLRSLSKQIEVNIAPELADNKTLKWTSDNEDVATVTQEGVVKSLKVGNANITATATDGSEVSATCKVTVKPVVIDLSTKTINLRKGESYAEQIVTVLPDNYEHKEVVWASADDSIASVDSEGMITAVKPGITTIKYSLGYDSSITAECKVIVYDENVVYVGGIYYIIDKQKSEATVTSIYGGKNTSLDAEQVAQCYSGTINIPESIIYEGYKYNVTKVGSYAFNCQNELQSIYIPRTVKQVEPNAAIKAEKLNRVNVADESQLENIGEQAFKLCIGLKRFVFDGTSLKLNTIGNAAFNGCTALEKVLWNGKSELKTIKDYAFFKCTSLNNFDMPNSTLSIGNSAFRYNEGLTDIHLSTSLNYIDEYAFGECGFSHITLPESLANIQAGAFINNEHLQDITLPERLQGLGSAAFENNSALESVTFHTALETMTIGNNAFNQCPVLSKVFITNMKSFAQTNFNNAKANPANTSQHIYNADGEEIVNVVLPKGTKYINNNAFNGCAYIQSIKMPATMDHINDDIFVGCSALKDVYCYAEEVPEFIGVNDPSAMNDVLANATLHVVYGHEQAYKADAWWKRFSNVEGCDAPSDDEVTSVVLNQTELTMKPDETIQLTATVYPTNAANKKVVWTSSNDEVAMVTEDGFVLAMAEGEADITATSAENSSIKAVCHIKVEKEKVPVITIVGIKFEESPVTISMGETKKLNVIFNPVDATNKQLEWKSTKTSVVDVDQEGNILGVSEGKAIITAKTTDGSDLTINCVVTVVPSTGINDINVGDVKLTVENRRLKVEGLTEKDIIQVVDYAGSTVYRGTDHEVYLNTSGVYIVKVKGKTMKIHVK